MTDAVDYSEIISKEAPEGTIEYCKERSPELNREYLIYRVEYVKGIDVDMCGFTHRKAVHGVCSKCGQSMTLDWIGAGGCSGRYAPAPFGFIHPDTGEHIISGMNCLCPMCGAEVAARHIGNMMGGCIRNYGYILTVGREGNALTLLGWQVQRTIDKMGQSVYRAKPYEAAVVEKKKMYRICGWVASMYNGRHSTGKWEARKKWSDEWGESPVILPWDPDILIGSDVENCKLDRYISACGEEPIYPISYLRLYQKYPQVENLIVQGFGNMVAEGIRKYRKEYRVGYYGYSTNVEKCFCPEIKEIDWKQKKPWQMLGVTKEELRLCKTKKVSLRELTFFKSIRATEKVSLEECISDVRKLGVGEGEKLQGKDRGGFSVMRCIRYLNKQNEKNGKVCDSSIFCDYLRMCTELEMDIRDRFVAFPKNIWTAHDRVDKELKEKRSREAIEKRQKEMQERAAGFAAAYEKLSDLTFCYEGIRIGICPDEKELIREGEMLGHCVATYAAKHSRGDCAIFFIRRESTPDEPWYTLELDFKNLKVLQNRGKRNCSTTPEVAAFEEKWLEHIKPIVAQIRKNKNKNKKENVA